MSFSFNKFKFFRSGAPLSVMAFIYIYSFITYILIYSLDCKFYKIWKNMLKRKRGTRDIQHPNRLISSIISYN